MTDVRLTALNPEDSKVYPVACNASGELLTTKSGDINLDVPGDLTVGGAAEFAGGIQCLSAGNNYIPTIKGQNGASLDQIYVDAPGGRVFSVKGDGSVEVKGGIINPGGLGYIQTAGVGGLYGFIYAEETNSGATVALNYKADANQAAFVAADSDGNTLAKIDWLGGATFAGGNAGFTEDGYLWCTTRRGDTVILDATSNGLATWADYTPPTRRDVIAEKLDVIADEVKKPGVPQDLPETEADTP